MRNRDIYSKRQHKSISVVKSEIVSTERNNKNWCNPGSRQEDVFVGMWYTALRIKSWAGRNNFHSDDAYVLLDRSRKESAGLVGNVRSLDHLVATVFRIAKLPWFLREFLPEADHSRLSFPFHSFQTMIDQALVGSIGFIHFNVAVCNHQARKPVPIDGTEAHLPLYHPKSIFLFPPFWRWDF